VPSELTDPVEFWTTEQVAAHLDTTTQKVYQSRRNGDWPGNVGKMRGRALKFRSDLIESGPPTAETTDDVQTAILWTLQGIESKLGKILQELHRQRNDSTQTLRRPETDPLPDQGDDE
jgi:hypothetical protein